MLVPESDTQLLVLNQLLKEDEAGPDIAKVEVLVDLCLSRTEVMAVLLMADFIPFAGRPKHPVAPFHLIK